MTMSPSCYHHNYFALFFFVDHEEILMAHVSQRANKSQNITKVYSHHIPIMTLWQLLKLGTDVRLHTVGGDCIVESPECSNCE